MHEVDQWLSVNFSRLYIVCFLSDLRSSPKRATSEQLALDEMI